MGDASECLGAINVKNYNPDPCHLSFKNITFKVSTKKKLSKTLLHNGSGIFKAGKLTAILGPSGAGKTTLMSILAGFKTKGVTGSILINGRKRVPEDRWKLCCIGQESALLSLLTIRETLTIAAELKMPSKIKKTQKEKVINDIADLLQLQKSMDTRVSKLSGGEIKRLSIGVELVTNPPIMFFDEPTSGLDVVSSVQIISYLKLLAQGGRTIVCVIHQPSSKIFNMFDDMYLISSGTIIYGGSVKNMVSTFQSAGFIYPQYYNRADFALEVASLELKGDLDLLVNKSKISDSDSALSNTTSEDIVLTDRESKDENDSIKCSSVHKKLDEMDEDYNNAEIKLSMENFTAMDKHRYPCNYAVSQWRQFCILFIRSSKCTYRHLQLAYMRVGMHILVAISLGLVYNQIGDEASKIHSNSAFLFFLLLFIYFANSMPTVLAFPEEAAVFQRENLNHWYSLPAYYFSKILADIPLQLLSPTLFVAISYTMTGQPMVCWRFAMVLLVCILFTFISQAFGLIAGVAFDPHMALFVLPATTIPMLMFSGFFIRYKELPSYMSGLSYVSFFGYGFEAIAQAVYGYSRPILQCSEDYCFMRNPEKFLKEITPRVPYEYDILILVGVAICFYFLLYLVLVFRIWKSRQ